MWTICVSNELSSVKEKQSDKFISGFTGHKGKDLGIHYSNEEADAPSK